MNTVTIERKPLLDAVTRVLSAIDKRQSMPILSHLHFVAYLRNAASVTATDLEIIATAEVVAGVPECGFDICVPGEQFKAALGAINDNQVEIALADNLRLVMTSGSARYEFACLPGEEFPGERAQGKHENTYAPGVLPRLLAAVGHAMSKDISKYNLCGTHLTRKEGRLTAVATDGHRLSIAALQIGPDDEYHASADILSAKACRLLAPTVGSIELYRTGNEVHFDSPSFAVSVRLLEGVFPDYARVIPKDNQQLLIVQREQFIDAITACGVVATDEGRSILIETLFADQLQISALSETGSCTTIIPYNGEALGEEIIRMRVNSRYLLQALTALRGEEVWIKYGPDKPLLLLPADTSGFDERLEVLMPMRS